VEVGTVLTNLGIALALGLLVGFQREWAAAGIAGIRTFAMIALLGALAGTLAQSYGSWIVVAGLLAVTAVMAVGNLIRPKSEEHSGTTTEVAALLVFLIGVAVAAGHRQPAVVVAGVVAVLLHAKKPLHGLVRRVGEAESQAIFRLVLIGLVILPVLPDRAFGQPTPHLAARRPHRRHQPRRLHRVAPARQDAGDAGHRSARRPGLEHRGHRRLRPLDEGRRHRPAHGAAAARPFVLRRLRARAR
jgi:hypothetical protein